MRVVVDTRVCFIDILDYVSVLFENGVFENILFCVRVVVSTRVCFGSCSRLRYHVVLDWCFRIPGTYYLSPCGCFYTCMFWVILYASV